MERESNRDPAEDGILSSIIAGRYRVERRIAKGGMATVYLATDLTLNRSVAIKVLPAPKVTDDPGKLLERFRLEAESLAKLNHRNIVQIYDYGGTEDGGYFLAMEFVDGKSMSQILRQEEFTPDRAIRLMLQVARALRYAHKKGIVHRDLKPGNVLVLKEEDEEVAKLVDFGLAKTDEDQLTQHGIILGSVHCMAPEQIRGTKIDQRTDIYAFGIVLFRLVVGAYPYNGNNAAETMSAHIHGAIPSFAAFVPNLMVPSGLEDVVHRCVQKAPEDRFPEMDPLIEALAACLSIPPEDFISVSILQSDALRRRPAGPSALRRALPVVAIVALAATAVIGMSITATLALTNQAGQAPSAAAAVMAADVAPMPEAPAVEADEKPPEPEPEPVAPEAEPEAVPEPKPVTKTVASPKPKPKPKETPPPPVQTKVDPVEPPPPVQKAEVAKAPPPAAVTLDNVSVDAGAQVVITLTMSNANVRPLHFLLEGASDAYPMQYVIDFKDGASGVGSKFPIASPLVESVTLGTVKGKLRVTVNSKQPVQYQFAGSGPTYTLTVAPK